jgi:hypothetical protein
MKKRLPIGFGVVLTIGLVCAIFLIGTCSDPNNTIILPHLAEDPLYTISLPDPAAGGTIKANTRRAAANEEISLTVMANTDWQLKTGTLSYNDNPMQGTTFIMPASDVTVRGVFELAASGSPSPNPNPGPTNPGPDPNPGPNPDPGPKPGPGGGSTPVTIPVTSITLNPTKMLLSSPNRTPTGHIETLVATVLPVNATEPVIWTTSAPDIVTLDVGNPVVGPDKTTITVTVTAVKQGRDVTITATAGGHTATCAVSVLMTIGGDVFMK